MFTVYIRNYIENGQIIPTERVLLTIPYSGDTDELPIHGIIVKNEMGKASSVDFTVDVDSVWYGRFRPQLTLLRIIYDKDVIFFGRVLDYNKDFFGSKKYHCEGAFSFLLDSYQSPSKESKRQEITALEWITAIIDAHNSQVAVRNPWKHIYVGEVPGNYTSATEAGKQIATPPKSKYGTDAWKESMSCLEELVSDNGGYMSLRYEVENGEEKLYLDWVKDYYRAYDATTMVPIAVEKNLIEQSGKIDISNLFTVLIPYGNKGGSDFHIKASCWPEEGHADVVWIEVPELLSEGLYTEEELTFPYYSSDIFRTAIDDYGIVYRVQKFENAKNETELFSFAKDWIRNNYRGEVISLNVKALDLHLVGQAANQYKVGDQVMVVYTDGPNDIRKEHKLCILSIQYDLENPENNSYVIGIPDNPFNKKYGTKQTGGGGGGTPPGTSGNLPDPTEYEGIKKKSAEILYRYMRNKAYQGYDPLDPDQEVDLDDDYPYTDPESSSRADLISQEQATKEIASMLRSDLFKTSTADILKAKIKSATVGDFALTEDGKFEAGDLLLNTTGISINNLQILGTDGILRAPNGMMYRDMQVTSQDIELPDGTTVSVLTVGQSNGSESGSGE